MKRLIFTSVVVIAVFLLSGNLSLAQVVVEVKPVPPKMKMVTPKKPGDNFVLIPGHWIWHRPSKTYVWVGPVWTPERDNRKWVPGHWREMPRGWKWVPGHWEKAERKKYFFNLL